MDIRKRQADRARILKAIFDTADGSEEAIVRIVPQLVQSLGLPEQEIISACQYLVGEGWIKAPLKVEGNYIVGVHLTHRGVEKVEQSLKQTAERNGPFIPSISVINIHGDVISSAIQTGSAGAQQQIYAQDLNLEDSERSRDSAPKD